VGDQLDQQTGFTREIFSALENIPVRMVSYGGSQNNLSLLIPESVKRQALQQLNQKLFAPEMANQRS
jgi:aspartate kinase